MLTDVSEELTALIIIITLTMEAVSASETSVNIYQTTRCNIAKDSHLHARRRENLKSRLFWCCSLNTSQDLSAELQATNVYEQQIAGWLRQ
jgi:hypothetical protein